MGKTVTRLTPFGGFDIPGLECWLQAMAAKGLRFSMTAGPLICFERIAPEQMQVHLEPIQGSVREDPALNAIYEEAGWQYWGMFRGNYFVYATADLEARAHTDVETLNYALKKFFRQKLAAGIGLLLANVLLLGLYWQGAPWEIDLLWLRYYPVETLSNGSTIPFLLAALGFLFLDLTYLVSLCHLIGYRRAIKAGKGVKGRGHRGVGWLLVAGLLVLLPVLINTTQLFAGADYRPYDLTEENFVTLHDIEGADFPISGRDFVSMDYISHGGTLLHPTYWYFRQCGAYGQNQSSNDVPHLEISIVRYPLEKLAAMRAEEWSRQYVNGSGDFQTMEPAYGLSEIRYAPREGYTHTSELTGEVRVFLPGGMWILRRGNTVLYADYYGEQDLTDSLERFALMMEGL